MRGGKREGAGAKPIYTERLVQLNVGVSQTQLGRIKRQAAEQGKSLAAYVREKLSQ